MLKKPLVLLSTIRWPEALIFLTPTLMGIALYLPAATPENEIKVFLACTGSCLVAASILAINDWADIRLDLENHLKRMNTFVERGIHPGEMLVLALALAAGGLACFALLPGIHVVLAAAAIVLGVAYSVPVGSLRGKSIPVFSSLLHFGGTLLSFLLGALTFATADWRSLVVASYPAVLITAGHLVQEVQDYEEDRLSNCRTNAVRFGRKAILFAASALFGFSFLLLYWLADEGLFPAAFKYAPILYLVYLAMAARAYRAGLRRTSVQQLRNQYRLLFAFVVLALLIGSMLNRWPLL